MAEDETTEWGIALAAALKANEQREGYPHTWYGLQVRLAKNNPAGPRADSWKSTIKRIRKDTVPPEPRAVMIAEALGVDREELPASKDPLSLAILERRLEELAGLVDEGLARLEEGIARVERRLDGRADQETTP